MQIQWFSHLKTKSEQEEFKKIVLGSQKVLDRAKEVCYNMIKSGERSVLDYDSPSWAYRQAHDNGRQEAFKEIIKFLSLDQDATH
jgi:hypothetical protein